MENDELVDALREAADRLADREETPEERKSRYNLYGGLIAAAVVSLAIIAAWALLSQQLSLSPNLPHCITSPNIAPICK